MKLILNCLLIFLIGLIPLKGHCFNGRAGVSGGLDYYFNSGHFINPNAGIFCEFTQGDKIGFRIGGHYGFKYETTNSVVAHGATPYENPYWVYPISHFKAQFMLLYTDAKFFFKRSHDAGGMYGIFGMGYNFAFHKTTFDYGPYDNEDYTVTGFAGEEDAKIDVQLVARIYTGYQWNPGYGKLFIEGGVNLPVTYIDGFFPIYVEQNLNAFAEISFGYIFTKTK